MLMKFGNKRLPTISSFPPALHCKSRSNRAAGSEELYRNGELKLHIEEVVKVLMDNREEE
jgi:hypothetical protein